MKIVDPHFNGVNAHRDTSPESSGKGLARFNKPNIPPELQAVREGAFEREIPVAGSLNWLAA